MRTSLRGMGTAAADRRSEDYLILPESFPSALSYEGFSHSTCVSVCVRFIHTCDLPTKKIKPEGVKEGKNNGHWFSWVLAAALPSLPSPSSTLTLESSPGTEQDRAMASRHRWHDL